MLAQKGEWLIRVNDDDTVTVYEVLMADNEFFCVGKVCYDDDLKVTVTSRVKIELYCNNEVISCLKEYGFRKMEE